MIALKTFNNRRKEHIGLAINHKGFTLVELLVGISISLIVLGVLYRVVDYYSSSFIRIDHKLKKNAESWKVVHALQEDIMAIDFIADDISNWKETIQEIPNGCRLTRRLNNTIKAVSYQWDKASQSLSRISEGNKRILIRGSCKFFSVTPKFKEFNSKGLPNSLEISLKMELNTSSAEKRKLKPLKLETWFYPEFLNKKLRSKYFHKGLPEL